MYTLYKYISMRRACIPSHTQGTDRIKFTTKLYMFLHFMLGQHVHWSPLWWIWWKDVSWRKDDEKIYNGEKGVSSCLELWIGLFECTRIQLDSKALRAEQINTPIFIFTFFVLLASLILILKAEFKYIEIGTYIHTYIYFLLRQVGLRQPKGWWGPASNLIKNYLEN